MKVGRVYEAGEYLVVRHIAQSIQDGACLIEFIECTPPCCNEKPQSRVGPYERFGGFQIVGSELAQCLSIRLGQTRFGFGFGTMDWL